MGLALSIWPFAAKSRRSVPLKRRLHAWWEGYELGPDPVDDGEGAADDAPPRKPARPASAFDAAFDAGKKSAAAWSATRTAVVQDIWTPGFIAPGGREYVGELVNGCGLSAAETMLQVGIGMGGDMQAIIGRFGNYVSAYEREPALADEARRQAVAQDIDGKVEIVTADPDKLKLKKQYFRAALLRDVLYTVEKKDALLDKVSASLKEGEAQLIITDLMFRPASGSADLQRWIAAEPHPVFPWTLDDLKKTLARLKIVPRIAEDESDRYRAMVVQGWKDYLARADNAALSAERGAQVVHEAEFWACRLAAIQSGALRYVRVVGVKNS